MASPVGITIESIAMSPVASRIAAYVRGDRRERVAPLTKPEAHADQWWNREHGTDDGHNDDNDEGLGAHHAADLSRGHADQHLEEVKRRTKVIGRFPGETSCLTLCWAVLDLFLASARGLALRALEHRQLAEMRAARAAQTPETLTA